MISASQFYRKFTRNKLRRRFYKPFNRLRYDERHFVTHYLGADFLVSSVSGGGLEISAQICEYEELRHFLEMCAQHRPDVFIDIGGNIGLYTCIVIKNRAAPRALVFEPDRRNAGRYHLGHGRHMISACLKFHRRKMRTATRLML
jgi:hypothetical protein